MVGPQRRRASGSEELVDSRRPPTPLPSVGFNRAHPKAGYFLIIREDDRPEGRTTHKLSFCVKPVVVLAAVFSSIQRTSACFLCDHWHLHPHIKATSRRGGSCCSRRGAACPPEVEFKQHVSTCAHEFKHQWSTWFSCGWFKPHGVSNLYLHNQHQFTIACTRKVWHQSLLLVLVFSVGWEGETAARFRPQQRQTPILPGFTGRDATHIRHQRIQGDISSGGPTTLPPARGFFSPFCRLTTWIIGPSPRPGGYVVEALQRCETGHAC